MGPTSGTTVVAASWPPGWTVKTRASPPGMRPRRFRGLACLLLASVVLAPARAAAADPGFCPTIREIAHASRTDFDRWRGRVRGSAPLAYDATRTLPRAFDCRIEREAGETHYTCVWEYREDEEAAARAAEARFLEGILDCLRDSVQRVEPSTERTAERRHVTLLVVQDHGAYSAELRVSSGFRSKISTWYVEFSANRRRATR